MNVNKLKAVIGITNKTGDNKFIPFFDFDTMDYPNAVLTVAELQKDFRLGTGFLIQSTNGFNLFFLDKVSFNECLIMCKSCNGIDKNYIKYAVEKNNFTLRLGDDKKFIHAIPSVYYFNELSIAHYRFFNEFFNTDILKDFRVKDCKFRFDSLIEIELVRYMSKKYGYIEVD